MKRTKIGVGILIVLLSVGAFYWWYTTEPLPDEATFSEEFELVLKNYEGEDVRLSEFKRDVLIVYLWASWCPYCGEELRNLAKLKNEYGDEVTVLAVNRAEPLGDAKNFTDQLQDVTGLVYLLDPTDALYKDVGGYAMPETLFINAGGDVTFHQRGPIQLDQVRAHIVQILE